MSYHSETPDRSVSRRAYLAVAGGASTASLAGCFSGSSSAPEAGPDPSAASTLTEHSSPELERWVDEVSRPGVLVPIGTKDGRPYYEVAMREVEQKLHRDLPPTTVWGYDGRFPGPTIEARQGEPIYVRWQNELPDDHLLPEDTTVHRHLVPYDTPGVRTVTHLHGGNVEAESDGKAQAWFTRDFQETGPAFEQKDYYYVNEQPPATLWYHDHSIGITRLNVYAGLAGFYLLRSEHEREFGLPHGEYEIPLVIQDRRVDADGSLFYPTGVSEEQRIRDDPYPEPTIVPQFYGDVSVVNGNAWPRLSVEPRRYRLRLLNGANSRYYRLKLLEYDERAGERGSDGPSLVQIGTDGGLLSEPVEVEDRLELSPSQRADVIVDFSAHAGGTLLLHNDAPTHYRGAVGGGEEDLEPLPEIMLVEVADTRGRQRPTTVPDELTSVPRIPLDAVDAERYLTLTGGIDDYGRMLHLLGTDEAPSGLRLDDPVTEDPGLGDTEIWSIANFTPMSHPIHLHLVHFQVLGRQPAGDYDHESDKIDTKTLDAPAPYERGWKDVVNVDPGDVVHVIAHFGAYDGLFTDQTGEYMWHCHMIEHEDHDMMRPFRVVPDPEEISTT